MEAALSEFGSSHKAFPVGLSGFGSFDNRRSKVIYINSKLNPIMDQYQQELALFLKNRLDLPEKNTGFGFHAHCTVAFHDLSPSQFHKAWLEFAYRKFEADFQAESISLLKNEKSTWIPIHEAFLAGSRIQKQNDPAS